MYVRALGGGGSSSGSGSGGGSGSVVIQTLGNSIIGLACYQPSI